MPEHLRNTFNRHVLRQGDYSGVIMMFDFELTNNLYSISFWVMKLSIGFQVVNIATMNEFLTNPELDSGITGI